MPSWFYDPTEVKTRPFPYRVIDTYSLEFIEIPDYYNWKGCYAILSHTWTTAEKEEEEKLYEKARDLFGRKKTETLQYLSMLEISRVILSLDIGTLKLLNAIRAAKNGGQRFIWVDSYCINKEDKAEHQISISSMGDWYMNASICLVFLADLALSASGVRDLHMPTVHMPRPYWTTRGWTVQEIILSQRAVFFNRDWEQVFYFDRTGPSWLQLEATTILEKLCRVPGPAICNGAKPDLRPMEIIALVASRNTTKPEDRVYSLTGLLGVKMRPSYGEGYRAAVEKFCAILGAQNNNDITILNFSGHLVWASGADNTSIMDPSHEYLDPNPYRYQFQ